METIINWEVSEHSKKFINLKVLVKAKALKMKNLFVFICLISLLSGHCSNHCLKQVKWLLCFRVSIKNVNICMAHKLSVTEHENKFCVEGTPKCVLKEKQCFGVN